MYHVSSFLAIFLTRKTKTGCRLGGLKLSYSLFWPPKSLLLSLSYPFNSTTYNNLVCEVYGRADEKGDLLLVTNRLLLI